MLIKYKNQLFDEIRESILDLNSFSYDEYKSGVSFISHIRFQKSPFHFYMRNPSDSYEVFQYKYTKFSPGYKVTEYYPSQRTVRIDSVLQAFRSWIGRDISNYLNENIEIDLWHEYQNSGEALNINKIDFDETELFKVDEQNKSVWL